MELNFNFPKKEQQDDVKAQCVKRCTALLKFEGVEYEESAVEKLVDMFAPCIRDIYSLLQKYYKMHGKIDDGIIEFATVDDKLIELIKSRDLTGARKFIAENGYSFTEVFDFLFSKYVPMLKKKGSAILTIAQYEAAASTSTLPDLQVAACIVSLFALE